MYFAAEKVPIGQPVLVLDGEGTGPANSVAELSTVAPRYAPPGQTLISVGVVGNLVNPAQKAGFVRQVRED